MKGFQRVGHRAVNFMFLGVKDKLGLDMLDIRRSNPLGLPGSLGTGKRTTGGGSG